MKKNEELKTRELESREKLEEAANFCIKVYNRHEKTKGDSWRDMIGPELWLLWEEKLKEVQDEEIDNCKRRGNIT